LKHLKALNKYFWKYRLRLGIGIFFIVVSNYFGVLAPQVTGFIIDYVQRTLQLPATSRIKTRHGTMCWCSGLSIG
jgi:ATP-binding cassette subfamily B protein